MKWKRIKKKGDMRRRRYSVEEGRKERENKKFGALATRREG